MPTWPTVAATGHRPQHLPPDCHAWVRTELDRVARKLAAQHGTTTAVTGMALGTDLWWAAAAHRAGLALWAHVPYPEQPARWPAVRRAEYTRILALAGRVTVYGPTYGVHLLHTRNAGMLTVADAVVAVLRTGVTNGGAAGTVRLAQRMGLPIIRLYPDRRVVVGPQT